MSAQIPDLTLFAGPSLQGIIGANPLPEGVRLLPPVKRRDVEALVEADMPGVMAIADGGFHHCLAVGHAEIRHAMEAGWIVWGLSSMGAIRAWEMRNLGMRGFGSVYARFAAESDFQDDEVALLHEPVPPYRTITEPLVHLRKALDYLAFEGILEAEASRRIADRLKALWYGDRTLSLFLQMVLEETPPSRHGIANEVTKGFDRFRIKNRDLESFLALYRASPQAVISGS